MTSLTLLGTGTPAPSLTRQSSGYLLRIGEDVVVVDHGPGAAHRLLEAGARPTDVSHLLLSHLHYDHIADYPRLVLQRWDMGAGSVPELQIFGPAPLSTVHERFFGTDGAYGPDIASRVGMTASLSVHTARGGTLPRRPPLPAVREIAAGDVIEGTGWQARVGSAQHFEPYLTCLGFRFESADGVLVYTGDTGGVTDEIVTLAKDCDLLVHMCHFETGKEPTPAFRETVGSHMDAATTAARAGAKALVLTHIGAALDQAGVLARLVEEMSAVYAGQIIVGEDLMELSLKAGALTLHQRSEGA